MGDKIMSKTKTALKKQIYKKVCTLFPELKERRSTMNSGLDWMENEVSFICIDVSSVNTKSCLIKIREYF